MASLQNFLLKHRSSLSAAARKGYQQCGRGILRLTVGDLNLGPLAFWRAKYIVGAGDPEGSPDKEWPESLASVVSTYDPRQSFLCAITDLFTGDSDVFQLTHPFEPEAAEKVEQALRN